MATKGRIQVIGANKDGAFIVQPADLASAQLLLQACDRVDGLKIEAAWPRRRGGRDYPALRLATQQGEGKG